MAKTTSVRVVALIAMGMLLGVGWVERTPHTASAANELKVSLVGEVQSEQYPTVEFTLSVVDATTGRPVTELGGDAVEVTDESGRLQTLDVTPLSNGKVTAAYVLLIDTGSAMAPYMTSATEVARGFIAQMGPSDVVRVVKFNEGVDDSGTNWVRRDDPNLAAQVSNLTATERASLVRPALIRATEIAATAPDGYARRAVVALVGTDGVRTEPGLTIDTFKASIRATTFAFGFGNPPTGHEELTFFLEEVRTYTGGGYLPISQSRDLQGSFSNLVETMRRTWRIRLTADSLPDGIEHTIKVTVRDALQRSGQEAASYKSGRVGSVSPIQFGGVAPGDQVTGDRDVEVTIGGSKQWASWTVDLFRDCDPTSCSAVASSENRRLDWKLVSAPLTQGNHQLTARLTVSDGQREFVDTRTVRFRRAGNSWNFFAPALVLGAGAVALVVTLALVRLRRSRMG
ncbi:MAG: hypothetical protein ABI782_10480 [Anaerolineaceae bacterium]